jgi:hypothetical protein
MAKEETQGEGTQEKPAISVEEKKKLFEAYEKQAQSVTKAEALLEDAKAKRSSTIKAIYEKVGAGPFRWGGKVLVVRKRGETFFFKSQGDEVEEIG